MRLIPVGRTGIFHGFIVFFQYFYDFCTSRAFLCDLVPVFKGGIFHLLPFIAGNGGKFQFPPLGAVVGFAPPIPVLTMIMRKINAQPKQGFKVFRDRFP